MLVVAALLTLAQAAAPAGGRDECLGVVVSSPQQTERVPPPAFSATKILDLELRTVLRRRRPGPHTLEVKVYTPREHLYQVLTVSFASTTREGEHAERTIQPIPFRGQLRDSVPARLPVAGTLIMLNSLYGEWKAVAHLDGADLPCGPPGTFVIEP